MKKQDYFQSEVINKIPNNTVVGIDIGSRQAKAVLLHKDEFYTALISTGFFMQETAQELLSILLNMKGTNSIISAVTNVILSTFGGSAYISAMTITTSLHEVMFLASSSIGEGTQAVLSFNYGAKEWGRVKKTVHYLTVVELIYGAVVSISMFLFADTFASIYTKDVALVKLTSQIIKIYFFTFVIGGLQTTAQTVFLALGQAGYAMFFALFRKVVVMLRLLKQKKI